MSFILSEKTVLISGASGAIGRELVNNYRSSGADVITLSRSLEADISADLRSEDSIAKVQSFMDRFSAFPDICICCNGILHDDRNMPEKSLQEISKKWLFESLEANLLSHIHLSQALESGLTKEKAFVWASISAMVGSIGDNYLGGWYSYRISKASLNMFVKTLSIEWARKNKNNRVFAIHPGTTRSKMSEPFKVRKDKLYEPETTAERISNIVNNANNFETGQFINWTGQEIPW